MFSRWLYGEMFLKCCRATKEEFLKYVGTLYNPFEPPRIRLEMRKKRYKISFFQGYRISSFQRFIGRKSNLEFPEQKRVFVLNLARMRTSYRLPLLHNSFLTNYIFQKLDSASKINTFGIINFDS